MARVSSVRWRRAPWLLALALALAAPAAAREAPAPGSIWAAETCAAFDVDREAADQNVVEAAIEEFNRTGYPGLRRHLESLRDVLSHAPSCFPILERRGPNAILRVDDPDGAIVLAALMGAALAQESMTIQHGLNTYPLASLMLGSYANEMRDYAEAITWLDRGLALQQHEPHLALEKATALGALHRPAEAVALLQSVLDDPNLELTLDRPRYLRNLGIHLIDLNRLDDAEAALNESIRLQPENPVARNELTYIAQLRAGGARQGFQVVPGQPTPSPKD